MKISTVGRYQTAFALLMENDQPTIEQHKAFIREMLLCAADYTEDRESYLRMAEAHERIVKIKQEATNGR